MKVLILDNKDSFTFNLSQLVATVTGLHPLVIANTEKHWADLIRRHGVEAVIISPGPGSPERKADFGICQDVVRNTVVPLLGVCLGHQGIGHAYGARVIPAPKPMHGRISRIAHDSSELFDGIPESFDAVRYHSLCLDSGSIPACLKVTSSTSDGVVMSVRHADRLQFGIQFHPESVCGGFGERLVRNFLRIARAAHHGAGIPPRFRTSRVQAPRPSDRPTSARRIVTRVLDRWLDPQRAFDLLFSRSTHAFWLDSSAIVKDYSRFSIMGDASGPDDAVLLYETQTRRLQTIRRGFGKTERVESLLAAIRKRLGAVSLEDSSLPFDFQTGLVGFFGYELRNELGSPSRRASRIPDAALFDCGRCVVFDHRKQQVFLVARVNGSSVDAERWFDIVSESLTREPTAPYRPEPGREPIVASLADGPSQYLRKIRHCQDQLAAGESYQICLSSEFSVDCQLKPYEVYRQLRLLNPAPYAAYLRFGNLAVLSSSPERFLRIYPDRTISAKPIKGTCARGADRRQDAQLAEWLRSDEKSRSENLTIVDLLRNDIGRVASTGSVRVPRLMDVESYATVHQLVSTITGRLRSDRDCLDCLAVTFPGGSMTGAPKLRTMEIIDRLENRARGAYSGAIGFLSYGGCMDLSIVIRTIVMEPGRATVASGGGIVAMSDPEAELEEMLLKARAPLRALAAASSGDPDAWQLRYATS